MTKLERDEAGRDDGGEGKAGGGAEASPPVAVAPEGTADALSPLEVILQAMRAKWQQGDQEGAASLARAAAPYVHVKASAGRNDGMPPVEKLSDAELDLIIGSGRGDPDQAEAAALVRELGDGSADAGGDDAGPASPITYEPIAETDPGERQ